MVHDILSTNNVRYANDIRTYTVGFLSPSEMGRCMGKMDVTLLDRAFLRSYVVLRRILRVAFV